MTPDTPAVLYVSIDRSGLSPVPVASFHKHPGAEEWIPRDAVRVKPLEWVAVVGEDKLCHDHWTAAALGGAYHMAPDEDSAAGAWLLQWTLRPDDFCMRWGAALTHHVDPEAAKAAAQADYEARILSALSALPAPDEGAQEEG